MTVRYLLLVHVRLGSVHANTLKERKTGSLLLAGLITLCIGTTGHHYMPSLSGTAGALVQAATPVVQEIADPAPVQAVAETAGEVQDLAASVVAPTPENVTRVVELSGEGHICKTAF